MPSRAPFIAALMLALPVFAACGDSDSDSRPPSAGGGDPGVSVGDSGVANGGNASDAAAFDGAVGALDSGGDGSDAAPAPPPTKSPRQRVIDYIDGISGKRTVAGQHDKYSNTPSSASDQVTSMTGKPPALWSGDFLFGNDMVAARPTMIAEAIKQWNAGAIVQLMYHACVPTGDESCDWNSIGGSSPAHLSDAQWSDLVTAGTTLNKAWLARLDTLSTFFQSLKSAGVAPLFRPIHEMNQGTFWWGGRKGANGTLRLFQITHDYLVKTKGFDNIIWVWDVQDFDTLATDVDDYNPGTAYYDIAALDVYGGGYDTAKYDAMTHGARGKPMAIGECNHIPDATLLKQQPSWVFFMLWPDFIQDNASTLPGVYAAPNVVTLGAMPGWK